MRYILPWLLGLMVGGAVAGEADDLRLIQARADLPSVSIWLDLPGGGVISPEQFAVSIGAQSATPTAIDSFEHSGEGVAYIFLVDISKSLGNRQFEQIRRALRHWLESMGEHDRAALITFGREVKQRLAFTGDRNTLGNAVDALAPTDMETALYRGLLEAINLGRQQQTDLPARRAIVVLSDGIDDSVSGVSVDEVFRQNQEYRVPIYSIGFTVPPVNDGKRQGLKVLGMLARQSGGHFVEADASAVDDAYEQQYQRIMQAYRLRVTCADCVADGRSYRVNLTWSDGRHSLGDGLDLRLLPKVAASNAPASNDDGQPALPESFMIFTGGLLLFLALLLVIVRQRLAVKPADELLPLPISPLPVVAATGLKVRLTVVAGMQKGKVYTLNIARRATVGRAPGCDLSIADDVEISAQHAALHLEAGKLLVRDLNSTNGTLVNGVPVHNDYPLRDGDLLLLGRTEMRLELPNQRT